MHTKLLARYKLCLPIKAKLSNAPAGIIGSDVQNTFNRYLEDKRIVLKMYIFRYSDKILFKKYLKIQDEDCI